MTIPFLSVISIHYGVNIASLRNLLKDIIPLRHSAFLVVFIALIGHNAISLDRQKSSVPETEVASLYVGRPGAGRLTVISTGEQALALYSAS